MKHYLVTESQLEWLQRASDSHAWTMECGNEYEVTAAQERLELARRDCRRIEVPSSVARRIEEQLK